MSGRIKRAGHAPSMRVPIIGKLKVGEKVKKNGKEYPTSLDYFRADSKYASYFHSQFGERPQSIPVVFISDNIADVCDERYELRDGQGRLFGKGNGESFEVWSTEHESYVRMEPTDPEGFMAKAAAKVGKEWTPILQLRFLIPDIRGVIGQWQLTTKALASSIPAMRDAFDFTMQTAGTVVNIPFDLQVEKVKSQKPGAASVFPVITLVPNVSRGHMEKIALFLESGHSVREIRGMLTEDRIDQALPKQLAERVPTNYAPDPEDADFDVIGDDDDVAPFLKD